MDIERINDNTVKFYISYVDIEERGSIGKKSGIIASGARSFFGR